MEKNYMLTAKIIFLKQSREHIGWTFSIQWIYSLSYEISRASGSEVDVFVSCGIIL